MRTIYDARELIKGNYGKRALVKAIGIRNKNEMFEGIISECYDNVFVLNTKIGKKSFSYSDVLVGNIVVKVK